MDFMDQIFDAMVERSGKERKGRTSAPVAENTMEELEPEEMADAMGRILSAMMKMMSGDNPQKMKENMAVVMPEIMKTCMEAMSSGETIDTMHEVMPKMMESCFEKMSKDERGRMLEFCHSMLTKMEANLERL